MVETSQVSLLKDILHKIDNEVSGNNKEQLFSDPLCEQDFIEDGTDLNTVLAYRKSKLLCSQNYNFALRIACRI